MSDATAGQSFADLISGGRRAKKWSQEDLERESGVSRSTLSRWERGLADRPEPAHVRAVCAALDLDPRRAAVSLGYLTQDEIDPPDMQHLPNEVREILAVLGDPHVPESAKQEWKRYLKYLGDQARGGLAG